MSLYNTYGIPDSQVYPMSYNRTGSSSPLVIQPQHYYYPGNANPGYPTYTAHPMVPREDPFRNSNKIDTAYSHIPNIETVLRTQIQDYITMGLEKQVTEVSTTKESTKILKNWLKVHRNNPYPSKTEKVMLAYSTHMTMTQISNWFANARRRIKQQKSCETLGDNILESSRDGNAKSSRKLTVARTCLSGIENTPETEEKLTFDNKNLSLSMNDSHITPDSGIESFIESDNSKNRQETKGENKGIIKCKTNLFGTDPVPDATLLPFGSVKDIVVPEGVTQEDKDIKRPTDTNNKRKIWSITDILNE